MASIALAHAVPGLPERFRIDAPLGRGGQAQTLAATDTETGEAVVVKVFTLAGSDAWKHFELFERECATLRAIEHPSIPRYVHHGGDEEAGAFYLVMQRADGESLQSMIDRGRRFTDAQLRDILEGLIDALAYLHDLNPPVIHRDVKPGNVVLRQDGHLWLVDFGSVRDALVDSRQSTVVGTYGYMAPEQLRGQSSPASDLYGVGATVAAVATGVDAAKLPSEGLEVELSGVIKPGELREQLQWLLQADPQRRPATVGAFRRGLGTTSAPAPVTPRKMVVLGGTAPARRAGPWRRAAPALVAVGVGTALVASAGAAGALVLGMLGVIVAFGSLQFLRGLLKGLNAPEE